MKKTASILLTTAIVGSLGLAALTPAAHADERGFGKRGERGERGEHMAERGQRGPGGPGGFIHLMCSQEGAARLEAALGNVGERLTLTDEQNALLDELKTVALSAQTEFADNCTTPVRGQDTDIIERMKTRQTNMAAHLTAMSDVVPALEAFYDSLTDDQKAQLKPGPRGDRGFRDDDDDFRGRHGGPRVRG